MTPEASIAMPTGFVFAPVDHSPMYVPLAVNFWMRSLVSSVTYTVPSEPSATPQGFRKLLGPEPAVPQMTAEGGAQSAWAIATGIASAKAAKTKDAGRFLG